jgi:hypothetical protein
VSKTVDPYAIPDNQVEKYLALKKMTQMLGAGKASEFFIGLARYFIDGDPYRATGVTVSTNMTPSLVLTQTGFSCDAYFPPSELLAKSRRSRKEINGFVKVPLEVRFDDIWLIAGRDQEMHQVTLFSGPPVFPE